MLGILSLIPREEKFFDYFERAASKVEEGARLLHGLLADFRDVDAKVSAIKTVEHEGDKIAHETYEALNRTFITPFDREDIQALAYRLDDILDFVDKAASRLQIYRIAQPKAEAATLVEILVRAVREVSLAVAAIRNLHDRDGIMSRCIEINRLENAGDQELRRAVARLFDDEPDAKMVMKWKEIYEDIENSLDRCEDVADILQNIIVKNA